MPDLPDIHTPLPDLAHESLRQSMVAALQTQADHLEQLADSFLLGQTAADGLSIALTNFLALQTALTQTASTVTQQATQIADLQAAVTDLQTRVTALEQASPTTPTGGGAA